MNRHIVKRPAFFPRTSLTGLIMVAGVVLGLPGFGPSPVKAAPGNPADAVAVVIDGQGNGHGRGLSQYGSLGWSVTYGRDWNWILDHYYGGTVAGTAPEGLRITVSLGAFDGLQTAIVAANNNAVWVGRAAGNFGSLVAREVSTSGTSATYKVWGTASRICPSAADSLSSWQYLGQVDVGFNAEGPKLGVIGGDDPTTPAGSLLGVCDGSGFVRHYRGIVYPTNRSDGANRTINEIEIESYLRGVVPRESPASWADSGNGAGINALRAQSVAARSYALAQGGSYTGKRYPHAKTCDTDSCQVYGGAATRVSATASAVVLEDARTDRAIADTRGVTRVRSTSPTVPVSTEFSSSNGDRTAGINFVPVDDDGDKQDYNPWSRWTRVLSAPGLASRYGLAKITKVEMVPDSSISGGAYGVTPAWAVSVKLYNGTQSVTVKASELRSAYGFPSSSITARLVTRDHSTADDFVFIGDSVGASLAGNDGSGTLPTLLNGVFNSATYDSQSYRCTVGNCPPATSDGLTVARNLAGSPDVAIVELGYNDGQSGLGAEIDQVMQALVNKGVRVVGWVTMSERRLVNGSPVFAVGNQAIRNAASRWPQLRVLPWDMFSAGGSNDRWFSDNVHLSPTGRAQFSLWLRDRAIELSKGQAPPPTEPIRIGPGKDLRIPMLGNYGIPTSDVTAVSFNLTAVSPDGSGFMTVWPCAKEKPGTSTLNFVRGQIVPNAVIAPIDLVADPSGHVCISSTQESHVIVDVNGWFSGTSGLRTTNPVRVFDTRSGQGGVSMTQVGNGGTGGQPLVFQMSGNNGIPSSGVAAMSLNLTVTNSSSISGAGFVTVYPCGSAIPLVSNLNFVTGQTVANAVIAPLSSAGEVCFYVHGQADVIVDVNGWFLGNAGFKSVQPSRIFDTRDGSGGVAVTRVGSSSPGSAVVEISVLGRFGLPASNVETVAMNVTVTDGGTDGFVTVYPCTSQQPLASNLNFLAQQTVANSVLARVSSRGTVCFYVHGSAHLLADISGFTLAGGGLNTFTPVRIVDTRISQGPIPGR